MYVIDTTANGIPLDNLKTHGVVRGEKDHRQEKARA